MRNFQTRAVFCAVLFLLAALRTDSQPDCPPEGKGGDSALNLQKNRTTTSASVRNASFDQIIGLNAKAVNKKLRSNWNQAELQSIASIEDGDRVTLSGLLFNATLSDPETCNCSNPDKARRDFHIWIVRNQQNAVVEKSFVVEITPRVRTDHPGWTLRKLRSLIPPKRWTQVRIGGLITFDNEHWNFVKDRKRGTSLGSAPCFPVLGLFDRSGLRSCAASGLDNPRRHARALGSF